MQRRSLLTLAGASLLATALPAKAAPTDPRAPLFNWYKMIMELVRHTATYSPPVAARAFAYLGVTAYEAIASGNPAMRSLAGQLTDLSPVPKRHPDEVYDDAVVLQAALAAVIEVLFDHTGPAGLRAKAAYRVMQRDLVSAGVATPVLTPSEAYGAELATHILTWAAADGAVVLGMGFGDDFTMPTGPGLWQPTNLARMQQHALLPYWGKNTRLFVQAHPDLPPPPDYSEDPGSVFYTQGREVYDTSMALTDDQITLSRFWSDDPLLTPTPAGHGMSIVVQILQRDDISLPHAVDALARAGVAQADAMTSTWREKYIYNRLRPQTYIRHLFDAHWEPLLITPPFPEYPSGHSVQSGTFATVMTHLFGDNFAFTDHTGEDDGLEPRSFPDFWAAAYEAGFSRLYGGIHFRAAIENGIEYGRAIGTASNTLKTLEA